MDHLNSVPWSVDLERFYCLHVYTHTYVLSSHLKIYSVDMTVDTQWLYIDAISGYLSIHSVNIDTQWLFLDINSGNMDHSLKVGTTEFPCYVGDNLLLL